jgi:hypothetical protein
MIYILNDDVQGQQAPCPACGATVVSAYSLILSLSIYPAVTTTATLEIRPHMYDVLKLMLMVIHCSLLQQCRSLLVLRRKEGGA